MDQFVYDSILAYLRTGQLPQELSKNQKDALRRKSKNFLEKSGLLFFQDKKNHTHLQVVTESQKEQVLEGCHSDELGGGHFGRDKTFAKISERYYWLGMVNDVKEFCKTCDRCQRANRKFDKFTAELHPIQVKDDVWHTIGVDLIGPLPETPRGNKFIMTATCLFSKWPEAAALPDKTATGVAEVLFKCFTRHGCCRVKISDQGREFVNKVNDELCQMTGVKCNITSAYHPQSNGQDERFNQTLQRQLLKFVSEEMNDWDLYLDSILFSYRVSRQDSTKASPFFLVYGRQAKLPIEFNLKNDKDEVVEEPNTSHDIKFEEHVSNMIKFRKRALENIQVAQKRQKGYYDAKHGKDKQLYRVGKLVLVRNCKKLSRKGSKMEPNWSGPYRIHEVLSKGTFKLSNVQDSKKVLAQVYNMTRLKLYHQRDCEDASPSDISDPPVIHSRDQESPCNSQDSLAQNQYLQESLSSNKLGSISEVDEKQRSFLQELKANDFITKLSPIDSLVQDIKDGKVSECISYSDYTRSACGKLRKFQSRYNSILGISTPQLEEIVDRMLQSCCNSKSAQVVGYTMDIVVPEVLIRAIMKVLSVERNQAKTLLYSSTTEDCESDDDSDNDNLDWALYDQVKKSLARKSNISDSLTKISTTRSLTVPNDTLSPTAPEDNLSHKSPTISKGTLSESLAHSEDNLSHNSPTIPEEALSFGSPSILNDTPCLESKVKPNFVDVETYQFKKPCEKYWIQNLQLYESDRAILEALTGWLNDALINAAQTLLKTAFPHLLGLQPVELGSLGQFSVETGEFIQILNNQHGHWLTVSTIGVTHPTVRVYDSMLSSASNHVKSQVAALLHTSCKSITLEFVNIHLQAGGSDCGLFAIAFMTALAFGISPSSCLFDQQAMRPHLIKCFEQGAMEIFPILRLRRPNQIKCCETFDVFCVCRMPQSSTATKWVQCSICNNWFHPTCVQIPRQAIEKREVAWHCPNCSNT